MLTNPKPAGWTDNVDTITATQIGSIATQLPNALDAIGGGTYAPTADIALSAGGGDLNLNCDVNHGGTSTTAFGAATTLTLAGATGISGAATITGSLTAGAGISYSVSSRSETRVATGLLYIPSLGVVGINDGTFTLPTNNVDIQELDIPHGVRLTSVTTWIDPPNDGVLPGTRPKLKVVKVNQTTGVSTTIWAETTDPTAVLADYEAHHSFSATGADETIDRTLYSYYAQVTGESGADATTVPWFGCSYTYTRLKIGED
jgi:hypothetical protein